MRYPDNDDYKNLKRVMKYIQGTMLTTSIMSINNSENIRCYVDAAFVVNKDMRIHTGGFVTTVTGGAYVQLSKLKLNTKNSTEANIVGVEDVLIRVI